MDISFGFLGIIGGLLCAVGDSLLDFKGAGNQKLGSKKMIDSKWLDMSFGRFDTSIILAAIGVPLYFLGFIAMRNQIALNDERLALIFFLVAMVGTTGGLFIHATVCLSPIIYKTLQEKVAFEVIDELINRIFKAVLVPFAVLFFCLVIGTSGIVIYAILTDVLSLSRWFIFLTPLSLMLIGWIFRLINKEIFADFPGIVMPSVGIAMIGLMAVLNG